MNLKMTQAWGWLVAAVLAAGMNTSYQDGGLHRVHELVDQLSYQVEHRSAAVLALASGHADRFLSEARLLTTTHETPSCPWAKALARVQAKVAPSKTAFDQPALDHAALDQVALDHFEAMSDRQVAQLERLDASRTRLEDRVQAQVRAQVAVQTAHIRIMTANLAPLPLRTIQLKAMRIRAIETPAVCRGRVRVGE
jgi:hypothetical protein